MKFIEERAVTLSEVTEMLDAASKKGELGYETANTLTYAQKIAKGTTAESQKLVEKLVKAGLTERQAVAAVNLMPKKEDEFRQAVVGADKKEIDAETLKSAFKLLK